MENIQIYIVIAVMVGMIIMFVTQKVSFGVTAMTAVAILAITGVLSFSEAFSGLVNKNTIMVATVMVLGNAISKTSLIRRLKDVMNRLKGKSGIGLMLALIGITILLCQVMGQAAVLTIIYVFIRNMDDDGELSQSRMLYLIFVILCAWTGLFPVGMGAARPMQANAYYEGMASADQMLGMFDLTKVSILPAIAMTVFSILAWKLIPKMKLSHDQIQGTTKQAEEVKELSRPQEIIVLILFVAVIVGFLFNSQIGDISYLIPVAGVLILIFTKIMEREEAVHIMTSDMVWMIGGMLAMSAALSTSGAGEAIGKLVLRLLGQNPSGFTVVLVFAVAAVVMSTFLSNHGTMAVLTPIAASTALAGGMDPRAVVLVVNAAAWYAVAFPTGCAAGTMAYSISKFDPLKLLKFNIPYLIIGIITLTLSVCLFFPM